MKFVKSLSRISKINMSVLRSKGSIYILYIFLSPCVQVQNYQLQPCNYPGNYPLSNVVILKTIVDRACNWKGSMIKWFMSLEPQP